MDHDTDDEDDTADDEDDAQHIDLPNRTQVFLLSAKMFSSQTIASTKSLSS